MGLTTEVASASAGFMPESGSQKLLVLAVLALGLFLFSLLRSWNKLRNIPGPWLAGFTNIPRLRWVLGDQAHLKHIELHRKYGKLVRFGPNMVSIGDATEIPKIYGIKGTYRKSDFYHVLLPYARGKVLQGLFSSQDENLHRILKRPIASIYSMSNLVSFEPFVDSTMKVFFEQLDKRFVETSERCRFDDWLQMFAFDVIGEITFSKRLGFLENATDVDGIMGNIWKHFQMASVVGQMPWLDKFWAKNPVLSFLTPAKTNPTVKFALNCMEEREKRGADDEKQDELNNKDFLSRFIDAKETGGDKLPPWALLAWTTSNITAGSDTTAIMLRTIFYHLLRHPDTLSNLLTELTEANLSSPVTWEQAQKLPYLDAVIKEAGRVHAPFALPLEREVPAEGATICGEFFEPGTIVGINAWVAHRDPNVFGKDCDIWRPERWTECEEEQKKKMQNSLLTFGQGHRSCIGKNISLLEVYKLVPSFLLRYKIEFADSEGKEWRVRNRWFCVQEGLSVLLQHRQQDAAAAAPPA